MTLQITRDDTNHALRYKSRVTIQITLRNLNWVLFKFQLKEISEKDESNVTSSFDERRYSVDEALKEIGLGLYHLKWVSPQFRKRHFLF